MQQNKVSNNRPYKRHATMEWKLEELEDEDCQTNDEILKAIMNRFDGILCLTVDTWPQAIP